MPHSTNRSSTALRERIDKTFPLGLNTNFSFVFNCSMYEGASFSGEKCYWTWWRYLTQFLLCEHWEQKAEQKVTWQKQSTNMSNAVNISCQKRIPPRNLDNVLWTNWQHLDTVFNFAFLANQTSTPNQKYTLRFLFTLSQLWVSTSLHLNFGFDLFSSDDNFGFQLHFYFAFDLFLLHHNFRFQISLSLWTFTLGWTKLHFVFKKWQPRVST